MIMQLNMNVKSRNNNIIIAFAHSPVKAISVIFQHTIKNA